MDGIIKNFKKLSFRALALIAVVAVASCQNLPNAEEGAFFTTPSNQQQDNNISTPHKIYIFSPSSSFNGAMGGRTGADQICQTNLPTEIDDYETHAILAFDATDDMTIFPANFGLDTDEVIYAYDSNVVIANNWQDLMDGSIDASMKDSGILAANTIYWTGFDPDGRLVQDNCYGFTNDTFTYDGQIGNSDRADVGWSAFQVDSCVGLHPILCIAF